MKKNSNQSRTAPIGLIFLISMLFSGGSLLAQAPYCAPQYTTGCGIGDQIESFSTQGGITNISNLNSGCSSGFYSFINNQEVTVDNMGSFEFTVASGSAYNQGFRIWVDWDEDNDFNDPGEDMWNSGAAGTSFTDTITAPQGAIGTFRMRVRSDYAGVPSDPCAQQSYGEVEDYLVTVLPGAPNDAGVVSIDEPGTDCSGPHDVLATIENFGSDTLNFVEIHWEVGGIPQPTVYYSTPLDTMGGSGPTTAQVNLGSFNFDDPAQDEIVAWTENPNGVTDTVDYNDTARENVDIIFAIIDVQYTTDATCDGYLDGTSGVTSLGGEAPFSYYWSTGDTGKTNETLPQGTHSVVLEDDAGCRDTTEITIGAPDELDLEVISGGATCQGSSQGRVEVEASGGTTPYNYNWNEGTKRSNLSQVPASTYQVTVTDANGCTKSMSVEIQDVPIFRNSVETIEAADCNAEQGSASLATSGGLPPYTYNWSNGETTAEATGLAAGDYQVTVTDAAGCEQIKDVRIPKFDLEITHLKPDSLSTSVDADSYQWFNCNTGEFPEDGDQPDFAPSTPGTYALIVSNGTCTDTSGCYDIIYTSAKERTQQVDEFKLYPNPNSGVFNVELSGDLRSVELELFDLQGKILLKKQISETGSEHIEQINESLAPGMYVLKVVQNEQSMIERFIVK